MKTKLKRLTKGLAFNIVGFVAAWFGCVILMGMAVGFVYNERAADMLFNVAGFDTVMALHALFVAGAVVSVWNVIRWFQRDNR